MAVPVHTAIPYRPLRAFLWLLFGVAALAGCHQENADHARQVDGLKADLEETKRRLSHVQNSLAAKDAEMVELMTTLETLKAGVVEKREALGQRDHELQTALAEADALKKRDAFVFGEIAAAQQQGQTLIARTRYEKFIVDFPKSALVPAATTAIAQLAEAPREVQRQMDVIDPKRKEREFQKTFNEGYMALPELGPILKKKTLPQVLALLGRPNQTFNNGTEIGYTDRATNPLTGTRGMLVIGFEAGVVANLRVEYAGRKMVP